MTLTQNERPAKGLPKGAAADGAQVGHANAAAILERLCRGPLTVAELALACGLSGVTARGHLKRLAQSGDVESVGKRWRLTATGTAKSGAPLDPAGFGRDLQLLPTEPHRAFTRLARDAVLVRYHHADRGGTDWLSFALWGETGGMKTGTAVVLGRRFGLAEQHNVILVTDRGRSDLLGRRAPDGKGGYRWEPAPRLSQPLFTLDELDKASSGDRETALRLLQGDSLISWEGEIFTMRGTVFVTFNGGRDPRTELGPDRLRRAVLLCTTGLAIPAGYRKAGRALLGPEPVPIIDLARFIPLAEGIDDEVATFFDEELPGYLSTEAQPIYPGHALSQIVPGRAVFDGIAIGDAAMAVGLDYLLTAATWNGTDARRIAAYCRDYGLTVDDLAVDDITARAIAVDVDSEGIELGEIKELGCRAIADELQTLGKPTDEEGIRLVGALKVVAKQLSAVKNMGEAERIYAQCAGLDDRLRQRASQIAGRQMAATGKTVSTRRGRVAPDQLAILLELQRNGSREAVDKMLSRLGLIEKYPMVLGESTRGRRYHGTTQNTVGIVIWQKSAWNDPEVKAILVAAIANEMANRPVLPDDATSPALLPWSGTNR